MTPQHLLILAALGLGAWWLYRPNGLNLLESGASWKGGWHPACVACKKAGWIITQKRKGKDVLAVWNAFVSYYGKTPPQMLKWCKVYGSKVCKTGALTMPQLSGP